MKDDEYEKLGYKGCTGAKDAAQYNQGEKYSVLVEESNAEFGTRILIGYIAGDDGKNQGDNRKKKPP